MCPVLALFDQHSAWEMKPALLPAQLPPGAGPGLQGSCLSGATSCSPGHSEGLNGLDRDCHLSTRHSLAFGKLFVRFPL